MEEGRARLADENERAYATLVEAARRQITTRSFQEARRSAQQAVAADPSRPEAYNLLGTVLELTGDWLAAQRFYRAALDMDPRFAPARCNLERTTSLTKRGGVDLGSDEHGTGPEADTAG